MDISDSDLLFFLEMSHQAARAGGQKLLNWMGKNSVCEKNPGDLVTEADYESQTAIRDFLDIKFPSHSFFGEEKDGSLNTFDLDGFCWIVDPLDGTTNFVHQLRSFSVSIALAYKGEVIVGTVLDPVLNECYSAARGQGTHLNGEPIHTSDCIDVSKSLLVASFTSRIGPDHPEMKRFHNIMQQAGGVRRLGSAALNFCFVACGRLDGYWTTSVKIWDVAAGVIILKEAGGVISHIDNKPFDLQDPRILASANPTLHQKLLPLMKVNES